MDLPLRLQVDASGGTLKLRKFDEKKKQLSLHVFDAQGKTAGIARFGPVSFLCLPYKTRVDHFEVCEARDVPTDFWHVSAPTAASLLATDSVVFIYTEDKLRHYIVAGQARYDRVKGYAK